MRAIIVEIFFLKKISVLADDQITGRYFNPMVMLHDPLAMSMSEVSSAGRWMAVPEGYRIDK
jgi:hypothetical protein